MKNLTRKQVETLEFIERRRQSGLSPSYREIGAYFGISRQAVINRINGLLKKGALSHEPGRSRTFKATAVVKPKATHTVEWLVPEDQRP